MATFCSARVRERRTRLWTIGSMLLASLVTAGLGGCGSTSNLLGGGATPSAQNSIALPNSPTTQGTQTAKFQIAPVIGSPDNVAHELQSQLASSIGREGLSVVTANNATGEYVVRGYIVAARERSKSKISYIWDVTDQSGKRVHRITGEEVVASRGKDPWSAVTPEVVERISSKTSKQIASWIASGGGVPVASNINTQSTNVASNTPTSTSSYASAAAHPAAPTTGSITPSGPITAVVPLVSGAPGDGGPTLTSAIQRELSKNGLRLATTPDSQAYKVVGKVAVGASADGKQPIQIDWNVIDPSGKKLGTVSQKNEVPTGSLDGAWGKTADAAAAAAAQGIIKLLPPRT